jgi:hypothetical protein
VARARGVLRIRLRAAPPCPAEPGALVAGPTHAAVRYNLPSLPLVAAGIRPGRGRVRGRYRAAGWGSCWNSRLRVHPPGRSCFSAGSNPCGTAAGKCPTSPIELNPTVLVATCPGGAHNSLRSLPLPGHRRNPCLLTLPRTPTPPAHPAPAHPSPKTAKLAGRAPSMLCPYPEPQPSGTPAFAPVHTSTRPHRPVALFRVTLPSHLCWHHTGTRPYRTAHPSTHSTFGTAGWWDEHHTPSPFRPEHARPRHSAPPWFTPSGFSPSGFTPRQG